MKQRKAYTLIEIIISIVILGIVIVPIAASYQQITVGLARSSDLSKAVRLSELEFSISNTIPYNDATLAGGYNNLTANYQGSGYDLRRQVAYEAGSDVTTQSLKGITVTVYKGESATPIIATKTLRAKNVTYGP